MYHENKDTLLSLFYREASPQEEQRARQHLAFCEDCREYMQVLSRMNLALSQWPDEKPLSGTFDRILANIPPEQPRAIYVRPAISARPIFNIAFAMMSILLLIYFVQSRISALPLWQSFEQYWFIQALGSFGFVALAFLGLGTFITLSLAPILYFDLNKRTLHI
ncbi:zf-HC2 domain-containing protein [candidate division KSB1 bacterium]|nr:zf-HC2 domain-containing protein [candidate division KSB1 bacterium]